MSTLAEETARRFLTFRLAEATYGIGILKVQEIIGLQHITMVPRTPHYVRGVINLRGRVIPVIDLCLRFDMEQPEDTERTCIIVTHIEGPDGAVRMGVVVEDVAEVVDIPADRMEEVPAFGSEVRADFLVGIGRLEEAVVLLLDIDTILAEDADVLDASAAPADGGGADL